MCGRFARYTPVDVSAEQAAALHELDDQLDLSAELNQREPQYNIAPSHTAAVMAATRTTAFR